MSCSFSPVCVQMYIVKAVLEAFCAKDGKPRRIPATNDVHIVEKNELAICDEFQYPQFYLIYRYCAAVILLCYISACARARWLSFCLPALGLTESSSILLLIV